MCLVHTALDFKIAVENSLFIQMFTIDLNCTAEHEWKRWNGLLKQRTIVDNHELDSLRIKFNQDLFDKTDCITKKKNIRINILKKNRWKVKKKILILNWHKKKLKKIVHQTEEKKFNLRIFYAKIVNFIGKKAWTNVRLNKV